MSAPGTTKTETELRAQKLATIILNGGKRSDCLRFASENWGIGTRQTENYLAKARALISADFNGQKRQQIVAEVLGRYSTLEMQARKSGQLAVALGCIHGAARVSRLIS